MNNTPNAAQTNPGVREVVGLLADRSQFDSTVNRLLDAGFSRPDLSVLASHQSIDAAGAPGKPWKDVLIALVGDLKYEGPLVASGAILLAGGATAAAIAAIIGAATAGIAAKELLDEVTSAPDTDAFARSLEAGSIIIWVRIKGPDQERAALDALNFSGASNVHIHKHKDP